MYRRTRYEQETIICFNEEEQIAEVFTYNRALQRQLDALAESRPEECKQLDSVVCETQRSATYDVPKAWVKIKPTRILSEDQKQKLSDRMKHMRTETRKRTL